MNENLKQQLSGIFSGNNNEAALRMARRYLHEDTIYWAQGANYECLDNDHDATRFIEAWQANTDYEIVVDGAFEGTADIVVGRDPGMDCLKVTLYGVGDESPSLYAELLRHVAAWIEQNADKGRNREDGSVTLGD